MKYVAFLRGINVGGHQKVKMEDLRKTFESIGFKNITTLLNSGNIIFQTEEINSAAVVEEIQKELKKIFGYEISVLLRSEEEITSLVNRDPFKDVNVTKDTRLYITFLSEKHHSNLKTPYESPEKDLKVLSVTPTEICTVITVSPERNTTDMMKIIETEFGKQVTTRNWNTVVKVYNALS